MTHLLFRYKLRVLRAYLAIVVDHVAQFIRVVTIVDGTLCRVVFFIIVRLHGSRVQHRLTTIGVVKMCLLKEPNAFWTQASIYFL